MIDTVRERIIEAALVLLKRAGPQGLTVEDAASLAGVTRKTVYNHFANRYALIDAATAAWVDSTISALRDIAEGPETNIAARFKAVVERGFEELRAGGRLMHLPAGNARHAGSTATRRDMTRRLRSFLEEVLREAAEVGYLREGIEARRLAAVILNVIDGLTVQDDSDEPLDLKIHILNDSLTAILGGILSERGKTALRDLPFFNKEGT